MGDGVGDRVEEHRYDEREALGEGGSCHPPGPALAPPLEAVAGLGRLLPWRHLA